MNVLVIGASGQVGSALLAGLASDFSVTGTYSTTPKEGLLPLDITMKDAVGSFLGEHKPSIVILAAALTNVDYCEDHAAQARLINVDGVRNVAHACDAIGAKLIYISTEYVFDGASGPYSEDDVPHPLGVYAKTKFEGEKEARKAKRFLIIRTTGVYSLGHDEKNFLFGMISRMKKGETIKVVSDQISTPTAADDLAKAVKALIKKDALGVYNVVGSELISRSDFAKKIARAFGFDEKKIVPIKTKDAGQKAPRPLNGGLLIGKLRKDTGVVMMNVEDGLRFYKHRHINR